MSHSMNEVNIPKVYSNFKLPSTPYCEYIFPAVTKNKYDNFEFIIENRCVGGNLTTTTGMQDILDGKQVVENR